MPLRLMVVVRFLAVATLAAGIGCATHRVRSAGIAEPRAPRAWLFYTDSEGARLVAVYPADATRQVEVESGPGTVSHAELVVVGDRDAATRRLTGVHAHAVVYLREDPAGVATVHTARVMGKDPPESRQVSRFALPSRAVCGAQVVPDHARPEESLFAIDTANAEGGCRGFEHRVVLVRLSMDASAEPLPMRPMVIREGLGALPMLAALYTDAGAISHLLVANYQWQRDGPPTRELRIISAGAPSQPARLVANEDDVLYVDWDRVWLVAGGRLRFHVGGGAGQDPGGVAASASRKIQAADGQYLYFVDGPAIRRVRLDGHSIAQTVHTVVDGTDVTDLAVSASRVLFRTRGAGGPWLWSVPKGGGTAARLFADSSPDSRLMVSGQSLFVVHPKHRAFAVRDDGVDPVTLGTGDVAILAHDTGTFAGGRYGYALVEESDDQVILLAEPVTAGTGSSLKLRSVDPLTRVAGADLGTLPVGYTEPAILRLASGDATLLFAKAPGGKRDVFLLDSQPGSLRQLTRTPEVDEKPVGPVSCGTAGEASLPVLGVLALGAWRRRRR